MDNKRKLKTTEIEHVKMWNDTHTIDMMIQPIDEKPPTEIPEIPTGIEVRVLTDLRYYKT